MSIIIKSIIVGIIVFIFVAANVDMWLGWAKEGEEKYKYGAFFLLGCDIVLLLLLIIFG